MHIHTDKNSKIKSRSIANNLPSQQVESKSTFKFIDNRPETIAQRKIQETIDNGFQIKQLKAIMAIDNRSIQKKTEEPITNGAGSFIEPNFMDKGTVVPSDQHKAISSEKIAIGKPLPIQSGNTVQREVEHDGKKYVGNGDRARWRKALKVAVINEYNTRKGASLSLSTDLSDEELDRCHKISFKDIENVVVDYLNGDLTQAKFIELTDSLTNNPTQLKQIQKFRTFLYSFPDAQTANSLLSVCNSAIGNVMLANASTNRSIQEHLDLHFIMTVSGDYSLTPESRSRADKWQGHSSGLPMTPTGGHIKSSSSGSIPKGSLTPGTKNILDGHGL